MTQIWPILQLWVILQNIGKSQNEPRMTKIWLILRFWVILRNLGHSENDQNLAHSGWFLADSVEFGSFYGKQIPSYIASVTSGCRRSVTLQVLCVSAGGVLHCRCYVYVQEECYMLSVISRWRRSVTLQVFCVGAVGVLHCKCFG